MAGKKVDPGASPGPPSSSPDPAPTTEAQAGISHSTGTGRQDRDAAVSSQQVSWWSVHEHVAPILAAAGSWPMVGTPAWCILEPDDPAKTAALYDAAQHWALRVETCQQAACEASHDLSAAMDWSSVAKELFVRRAFYAHRPWLKRVAHDQ